MPKLKEDIYLVAALRTPIGRFGGALAAVTAPELGTESAKATIARSGIDPGAIDEVIFGNARQAGVGPNVARQVAIKSGLRHEVPAYTVNQACGSGLRAIMNAADQIRLSQASVVLAGGTESMSNTPYLLMRARWGKRMGNEEVIDGMFRDGFMCPLADEMMGSTAETLADRYGISRQEQDEYAVETRVERGVCRAGAGLRPRAAFRSREAERAWRRYRVRPPDRLYRRAHHDDSLARIAIAQEEARSRDALHFGRDGAVDAGGKVLMQAGARGLMSSRA